MEKKPPTQEEILSKINDLLATREAKLDTLRNLNKILMEGYEMAKCFPSRWYVKNPQQNVLDYLNVKYKRDFLATHLFLNEGYGELHGEFAHVPHDVSYSWEITQEEFNYILSLINQ